MHPGLFCASPLVDLSSNVVMQCSSSQESNNGKDKENPDDLYTKFLRLQKEKEEVEREKARQVYIRNSIAVDIEEHQ